MASTPTFISNDDLPHLSAFWDQSKADYQEIEQSLRDELTSYLDGWNELNAHELGVLLLASNLIQNGMCN